MKVSLWPQLWIDKMKLLFLFMPQKERWRFHCLIFDVEITYIFVISIFYKWKNNDISDLFTSYCLCINVKFPVTLINSFVFCFENTGSLDELISILYVWYFSFLKCCLLLINRITYFIHICMLTQMEFHNKIKGLTNQIVKEWGRGILINKMALKMGHPYLLLYEKLFYQWQNGNFKLARTKCHEKAPSVLSEGVIFIDYLPPVNNINVFD